MRISVCICAVLSFIFFAYPVHSKELPEWMKPLPIEPELLRPPVSEGFVFVKGGCFQMGDTFGDGESDDEPVHEVCVDDFYMGKYEVTQKEWKEIMGNNPSYFKGCDNCPVEGVSWNNAQKYISKLNSRSHAERGNERNSPLIKGGQGVVYRLPTEAEWEYAARSGGKKEKWAGTSIESELKDYAWYDANSDKKTHPVGQKKPNGLGLYDMTGNVGEWVADWYDSDYYRKSPRDNPQGASSGYFRVLRGGSWNYIPQPLRASSRHRFFPALWSGYDGFRLVRTK